MAVILQEIWQETIEGPAIKHVVVINGSQEITIHYEQYKHLRCFPVGYLVVESPGIYLCSECKSYYYAGLNGIQKYLLDVVFKLHDETLLRMKEHKFSSDSFVVSI